VSDLAISSLLLGDSPSSDLLRWMSPETAKYAAAAGCCPRRLAPNGIPLSMCVTGARRAIRPSDASGAFFFLGGGAPCRAASMRLLYGRNDLMARARTRELVIV